MATRTQAREVVFSIIYAYDIGNKDITNNAKTLLESKKIKNKHQDFALSLINGVIENLEILDFSISKQLSNQWDFARIGAVEKAILRLGAYELFFSETDSPVIINEAVELAKSYAEENASKLVNGVLDSVKNENIESLRDELVESKKQPKKIIKLENKENKKPFNKESKSFKKPMKNEHKRTINKDNKRKNNDPR